MQRLLSWVTSRQLTNTVHKGYKNIKKSYDTYKNFFFSSV